MTDRVLFYAQHLLGIGHLVRSLRICAGLVRSGWQVDLVIGGVPVAGLSTGTLAVTYLPPLKAAPEGFTRLVTSDGRPADETFLNDRRQQLLALFERVQPNVLIIEAFPFGRRQMRFELIPLLEAAHRRQRRPVVAVSIRDILQLESRAARIAETEALLAAYFDAVLVHGDPAFMALDATFPSASLFAEKTHYTGVVGPERREAHSPNVTQADVIVAAGGGAVGAAVIECAIRAKPSTRLDTARWIAVTGPNMPAKDRERLAIIAASFGVELTTFLADLPAAFEQAQLAICQAGYNTVADLLAARCRSVLVPFTAGGETEQASRAGRLQQLGLAATVSEAALSVETLAAAVDHALVLPSPIAPFGLDGAARTAAVLRELIPPLDSFDS